MADDAVRALEREVDEAGSPDARHRLTRERLRAGRGIVAYWPGAVPPHPSAVRVGLSLQGGGFPEAGASPVTHRSEGWALAVGGAADVFEVAQAARAVTLLDLADGRWVRCGARRAEVDLGSLSVAEQPTTTDALGRARPRGGKATTAARFDATRFQDVEDAGLTASIWREEPLYDSDWWDAAQVQLRGFQNFHAWSHVQGLPDVEDWARYKQHGLDTNLAGTGPCLPQGYCFDATGFSVALLDARRKPLPDDEARAIAAGVSLRLVLTASPLLTVPLADALELAPPEGEGGFVAQGVTAPPMVPFAWPFRLSSLEQFSMHLDGPGREARSCLVRFRLHGFVGRVRF